MSMTEMQAILRRVVRINAANHAQLQAMEGFDIADYLVNCADGYIPTTASIPDLLDTFAKAIMELIAVGVGSEEGLARVQLLRQRINAGVGMIGSHCRQYAGQLQDWETFAMVVGMINDDLGIWTATWLKEAVVFRQQHEYPRRTSKNTPPVITPQ